MPSKDDPNFPSSTIYASSLQDLQYAQWASYLRGRLATPGIYDPAFKHLTPPTQDSSNALEDGASVKAGAGVEDAAADLSWMSAARAQTAPVCEMVADVLSVKNALVSCRRVTDNQIYL
jgi:hypothetical protein